MAGGIVLGAAVAAIVVTIAMAAALGIESGQVAVSGHPRPRPCDIDGVYDPHDRQAGQRVACVSGRCGAVQAFGSFLKSKMGFNFNKALALGVVFTVISVAITWAAFVTQFFVTDMKWGSMGADSAFAGAIATTIVTVLLFVIFTALGPIGAIVGAIIGLINAIAIADLQRPAAGDAVQQGGHLALRRHHGAHHELHQAAASTAARSWSR